MIAAMINPLLLIGALAILAALSALTILYMFDSDNRRRRHARTQKRDGPPSEE